ncbi:DUF3467 domain-containing protein [Dactylosporangium salmoneum]|uniref:DUF3467 domain-containing protein n=1 Tax=Dactylosporangium salmoneum TaxID=53361 RepID=A0ABP5UB62_9ACTN
MTHPLPEGTPPRISFNIPPEIEAGVYANFVNLWHQPDGFILDFSVFTAPPGLGEDDAGNQFVHLPARVVSRVRIPPQQVFELMKALSEQLSAWELETGRQRADPDTH